MYVLSPIKFWLGFSVAKLEELNLFYFTKLVRIKFLLKGFFLNIDKNQNKDFKVDPQDRYTSIFISQEVRNCVFVKRLHPDKQIQHFKHVLTFLEEKKIGRKNIQ